MDACYSLALYIDANNAIMSNKHHEIFIGPSGSRHECSFQPVIYFVSRQMLLSMKGCLQPLMILFFLYWGNDKLQNKSDLSAPISCFGASLCAPDFMEESILFVMGGHFDVETSWSDVGAGLCWMELWINTLRMLWFIKRPLVRIWYEWMMCCVR